MAAGTEDPAPPSPRLLDQLRDRISFRVHNEQAYLDWIRRFIWIDGKRHAIDIRTLGGHNGCK